jgi:hypothetical protein
MGDAGQKEPVQEKEKQHDDQDQQQQHKQRRRQSQPQQPPSDALPGLGQCVVCLYDYKGAATHLSFKKGDVIVVSRV